MDVLSQWLPAPVLDHLALAISLLWGGYLVLLAGWIALQKREPIATLSWLLALALLPVLGFVIYHFLGPRRIQRQQLKRLRAKARLDASWPAESPCGPPSPLMRLAQGSGGFAPSSADRVVLLDGGSAAFEALFAAIAEAKFHVHLEYYILEPDRIGLRLRELLVERARAGVRVRLLLDAIGSARIGEAFLRPLREAGAEVAFFHRFRLRRLWRPKMNLRTHRKIAVVDGHIGFTGGVNLTEQEDERLLGERAYRDLHLRLDGDAVLWLQLAFIEDWTYAGYRPPQEAGLWPADLPTGPVRVAVLPSGPDSPWETLHRTAVAAIQQARARVWLATPYFVPGEAARMALTSAALRGLDVRVLVPRRSDSWWVTAAARSYYDELAASGVKVFEYPRMLHTKALLVDEATCLLGSSNFDHRSFRLNFELDVLVEDAGVATALDAILAADLALATAAAKPRVLGLPERLAEALARLLSPLL